MSSGRGKRLNNMENFSGNQKENTNFSEEKRKEISYLFMKNLHDQKSIVENDLEIIKDTIADETVVESFKGLLIFSKAVQSIASDERIPEKERTLLKVYLMDLNPIGVREVMSGISSYAVAIKSVISILDDILTKEVSTAVHVYAEKIFLPPAQSYYNEIIAQ